MSATTLRRRPRHPPIDRAGRQTVYVWELPVRIVHWTIVLAILVLTLTGFWLYSPFFRPSAIYGWGHPGYTLAVIRFIHEVAGGIFIAALLGRVYWAFAGNRYASWRALLPITPRQRFRLRETICSPGWPQRRRPAPCSRGRGR
jgi:Ni/Fe-hydrogenase 1 B-type cytochrome subunit